MDDGWMKRDQTSPPARSPRHAKPRQRKVSVITDTDQEWQPQVDPRPCRLTCAQPSADVAVSAPQPQAPPPLLVRPTPLVAQLSAHDPLKDYTPLAVRSIPSDEDWLMEDAKPAEQ